jgi:hypothetical protein
MPKKTFNSSALREITGFKPSKKETDRLKREQKSNTKANKQVFRDFDELRKKDPTSRKQEKDFREFRESNRREREEQARRQQKEIDNLFSNSKKKKNTSGIKKIVNKVKKSILG